MQLRATCSDVLVKKPADSAHVGVIVQGFLPEAADAFIVDRIYPTFSPQLGVLFACSTVYGLWKVSDMR